MYCNAAEVDHRLDRLTIEEQDPYSSATIDLIETAVIPMRADCEVGDTIAVQISHIRD